MSVSSSRTRNAATRTSTLGSALYDARVRGRTWMTGRRGDATSCPTGSRSVTRSVEELVQVHVGIVLANQGRNSPVLQRSYNDIFQDLLAFVFPISWRVQSCTILRI